MQSSKKPRKNTTVENQTKFVFRLPSDLYEWIQREAQGKYRSMNSVMIEALQEYKAKRTPVTGHEDNPDAK